ncbi:MAG: cisplatin damage response ATP-dependent DNA ligase, partial [Pseudomonadota bacterium]|nr:cisplatin damage response ATP-dependent DNA ligase [Pseudomonadota bacterium]
MKRFADLFRELDQSTATGDKRGALVNYFRDAPPADAAWAVALLSGAKLSKIANTRELREWISQESGQPDWLVDESHDHVGDLAETLTLLMREPLEQATDRPLVEWIERVLLPIAGKEPEVRRAAVVGGWHELPCDQRLLFNKLLTGSLRVGVSQRLVQQALAEMSGIDISRIAQRMIGAWAPTPDSLRDLLTVEELPGDREQPYPFFLASPLENEAPTLGDIEDWLLEWKWDGIRLQLIRRQGEVALWSRGEERLDGRFPEIETAAATLPSDCVIDGELLAWREGDTPLPFGSLQTRIQRRKPGAKTLADAPARVLAYDLLELQGTDLRERPLSERRALLQTLLEAHGEPRIRLSPAVQAASWDSAALLRESARERGVEGLMLKRASSTYQSGRRRGDWWKWKIDPLTIDA